MEGHEEWMLPARILDAASGEKPPGVGARIEQFDAALQRDESKNDKENAHRSSVTNAAVKPGPIAVNSARRAVPFASAPSRSARSNTNSTVTADMFP